MTSEKYDLDEVLDSVMLADEEMDEEGITHRAVKRTLAKLRRDVRRRS
jgi:hypothetical protein